MTLSERLERGERVPTKELVSALRTLLRHAATLQVYARRYSDGRRTYASADVNHITRDLLDWGAPLEAPDKTIWAEDGDHIRDPSVRAFDPGQVTGDLARKAAEAFGELDRQWTGPARQKQAGAHIAQITERWAQEGGWPAGLGQQLAEQLTNLDEESRTRLAWALMRARP